MLIKHPASNSGRLRVTFSIPVGVWAKQVHLVGDVNGWEPGVHPLEHSLHNGWRITLELPQGRAYQFRYLLDGRIWRNDCGADGYVPNPFGEVNSVVHT